jgi:transposase
MAEAAIKQINGHWASLAELGALLGISRQAARKLASDCDTRLNPGHRGQGGKRIEVDLSTLPQHIQARIDGQNKETDETALLRIDAAPGWAVARAEAREAVLSIVEGRLSHKKKAAQRRKLIKAYNAGAIGDDIPNKPDKISYATYNRWLSAYQADGLAGLLPANRGRTGSLNGQIAKKLRDYALGKPRAAATIYDYLVAEYGDKCPSYATVLRRVKKIRKDNAEIYLGMAKGPNALRHVTLSALGNSAAKAAYPNHIWEIDSSPADVMDANGKRNTVVGIVDLYTKRYHFRLHPRSNGLGVAQTIRTAILEWGIPDVIIMDNGNDYQSRRVAAMCAALRIHIITNDPYSPEQKPAVERSFRTLSERCFRELLGYTGNCILTRPEEIKLHHTADDIQLIINKWLDVDWHERPRVKGKRPRELAGERTPRRVSDERVLDILLGDVGTRGIKQSHIKYKGRKFFHEKLLELDSINTKVHVREDASDAGRIYVFHEGAYFCTATDVLHLGLSPEELRLLQKKKLRIAKARVAAFKQANAAEPETPFMEYLDRRAAEAPATLPGPAKVVQFPELEAAAADQEEVLVPSAQDVGGDHDRPAWWESPEKRYEWTLEQQARNGDLLPEDIEFLAEYEASPEYASAKEAWDFFRATLELPSVQGGGL